MKTKLVMILLACCTYANAQTDSLAAFKKNAVYFEGLGNGLLYSINYERMIFQKNKIHVCGRVGVEVIAPILFNAGGVIVPLEVNLLVGKKKKFFEIGFGYDFIQSFDGKKRTYIEDYDPYDGGGKIIGGQIYPSGARERIEYREDHYFARVGFRRQYGSGFFWRAGWTPLITYKAGYKMEPYDKIFGMQNITQENRYRPVPEEYANVGYKEASYKVGIGLLWAGFSVGFRF